MFDDFNVSVPFHLKGGGNKPIALMTDSSFSYLGIEYEEAVIWVVSVLCGAIVPLFAHFSVLLHAFSGIIEN